MAAVPIILAAVAVVSSIQQSNTAKANAQSQANIASYNQKVSENNATSARQAAAANEEAQRRQSAVQLGRLRAGIVESGGGTDGSNGDLYGQSAANADLDAKNILYAGELKGQGLDSEAYMQGQAAERYRSNASSIGNATLLNAGTAALSSYSMASSSRFGKS